MPIMHCVQWRWALWGQLRLNNWNKAIKAGYEHMYEVRLFVKKAGRTILSCLRVASDGDSQLSQSFAGLNGGCPSSSQNLYQPESEKYRRDASLNTSSVRRRMTMNVQTSRCGCCTGIFYQRLAIYSGFGVGEYVRRRPMHMCATILLMLHFNHLMSWGIYGRTGPSTMRTIYVIVMLAFLRNVRKLPQPLSALPYLRCYCYQYFRTPHQQ